jgi:hypothetical protein
LWVEAHIWDRTEENQALRRPKISPDGKSITQHSSRDRDETNSEWYGDTILSQHPLHMCETSVIFRIFKNPVHTIPIVDFGITQCRGSKNVSLLQNEWKDQLYQTMSADNYLFARESQHPHLLCLNCVWKLTINMETETIIMECWLDNKVVHSYSEHLCDLSDYRLYGKAVDCTLMVS